MMHFFNLFYLSLKIKYDVNIRKHLIMFPNKTECIDCDLFFTDYIGVNCW